MKIEDYPEQEPFTEFGARYHAEVLSRAINIEGIDLAYGNDPYQGVAVFPAQKPNSDVLCVMHGGGWTNGYKEWMAFMASAINDADITMISIGYRLAPQHVFPAGYQDCCAAIGLVAREIANYGGNPDRLFIGGHSAGGHYASLLALRQDWQGEERLPENIIKGVLPISATFEFGPNSGLSMRPRFLGPEEDDTERVASPINYIHSNSPPFLVSYGESDFGHLILQAKTFCDALEDKSVSVSQLELQGCDHFDASYASGEVGGEWINEAAAFIRAI